MTPVRVAVDLMGGDHAPDAVIDGVLLALDEQPGVVPVLVGPPEAAGRVGDRIEVVAAHQVIEMTEDPARAVRSKRDATVRVACRLVRDGAADAVVSAGSTGAVLAAALFTIGRLPGITRAPLAVVIPAHAGPLVLLDAGANPDCDASLLAQFALAGAAYATVRLGIPNPRVGLLTNAEEPGKGDGLRRAAYDVLAGLPLNFAGSVEGRDVALGGKADVVVTDGFTGNVLLKGIEGAVGAFGRDDARASLDPDRLGGAMLLGVKGVVVVAHGASSSRAIGASIDMAAHAVRERLVARTADALAVLVAQRRVAAGFQGAP